MSGFWKFVASYYVIEIIIVVIAVVATWWGRKRRLKSKRSGGPPPGYVQTDEVFIDPTTGITQQVWYNPATGERFYETRGTK